jgi:hypothetical protein
MNFFHSVPAQKLIPIRHRADQQRRRIGKNRHRMPLEADGAGLSIQFPGKTAALA